MHLSSILVWLMSLMMMVELAWTVNLNYQKYDVIGWDWFIRGFVNKANALRKSEGLRPVMHNFELMKLAQIEAERLAGVETLDKPFKLKRKYRTLGQSSQVLGFIRSTNELMGSKVCYDNYLNYQYEKSYAIKDKCFPTSVDELAWKQFGYGRAMDSKGTLYSVTLYQMD